jgi:hypothetical protein
MQEKLYFAILCKKRHLIGQPDAHNKRAAKKQLA